ncbi:MAG TPA: hypothetical protein DDY39_10215, partial [Nitrospira sp.]|nr:hypothetical protein [Nitrospira sp.]
MIPRSDGSYTSWVLRSALCGALMVSMFDGIGDTLAAEWSAVPSLSVKGIYNSNLLLRDGNNEVWGNWVTPALRFKGATESLSVETEGRADFV